MDGNCEELGVGGAVSHLGQDGWELVGKSLLYISRVLFGRREGGKGRRTSLTKPTMLEHMASQVGINTL